jgi:hypothetical protein
MAIGYGAAVALLYRAPLEQFVAERKRLAQELKAAGDKENAGRLSKLPRPPLSAWAVNQLWWHSREAFEQLLAAAERLRGGDLGAGPVHRDVLAKLRAKAAALLTEHGHSAPDATLRRVAATLAALAANGGFEPDPPGALGADRDPPGFDAAAAMSVSGRSPAVAAQPDAGAAPEPAPQDELAPRREQARADAARRESEAAEARRLAEERRKEEERRREQERAERIAARKKLEAELAEARSHLQAQSLERDRLRAELTRADTELARARSAVQELEVRLGRLDPYERLS